MEHLILPDHPAGRRIRWDSFSFGHHRLLFLRCVACLAVLVGVIGVVVVGVPLLTIGAVVRVVGPSGPIGPEHHPVFWLATSLATAFALSLASLGIAAVVRAADRDYRWAVFERVVERERDLLDEVGRDLPWLNEEPTLLRA